MMTKAIEWSELEDYVHDYSDGQVNDFRYDQINHFRDDRVNDGVDVEYGGGEGPVPDPGQRCHLPPLHDHVHCSGAPR